MGRKSKEEQIIENSVPIMTFMTGDDDKVIKYIIRRDQVGMYYFFGVKNGNPQLVSSSLDASFEKEKQKWSK